MARIRNQKQGSSTKPLHQKKPGVKARPVEDSSDGENLVTEAHETNDVSRRACIDLDDRFSSSSWLK